jgi:hypothetical protein
LAVSTAWDEIINDNWVPIPCLWVEKIERVSPLGTHGLLLKEMENLTFKFSKARQCRQQPTITQNTLRNVIWVHIVEELTSRADVCGASPLNHSPTTSLHVLDMVGSGVRAGKY